MAKGNSIVSLAILGGVGYLLYRYKDQFSGVLNHLPTLLPASSGSNTPAPGTGGTTVTPAGATGTPNSNPNPATIGAGSGNTPTYTPSYQQPTTPVGYTQPNQTVAIPSGSSGTTPTNTAQTVITQPATQQPTTQPATATANRMGTIMTALADKLHREWGWTLGYQGALFTFDEWNALLGQVGATGTPPAPESLGLTGNERWAKMDWVSYFNWLTHSGGIWFA